MTWLRLDDQVAFHAKTISAGNEAFGCWVRLAAWSCAQLTDGFVPNAVALSMCSADALEKLVEVRYLDADIGGYRIHDFSEWNPKAADVKAKREADKSRKAKTRETQFRDENGRWSEGCPDGFQTDSERIPSGQPTESERRPAGKDAPSAMCPPLPSGSRPDPDLSDPDQNQKAAGSRSVARPVVDLASLTMAPLELAVRDAIVGDPTLEPICKNPNQLARDLVNAGPGLDVALAVRKAGAWLRASPTRAKKNGAKFLVGWISRQQDSGMSTNRFQGRGPVREQIPQGGPEIHSGNFDISALYDELKAKGDSK